MIIVDYLGPLGVIEFTVNYLKDDNRLDIHIQNAKVLVITLLITH